MEIYVSEFGISLSVGHPVVQPCMDLKRIFKYNSGYFPISQPNHYNIMMVSICTDEYCIRTSAKLWLGQCVHVMSNRASLK